MDLYVVKNQILEYMFQNCLGVEHAQTAEKRSRAVKLLKASKKMSERLGEKANFQQEFAEIEG